MPNDKGKTTEAMGGYMKAIASQTKKSRRPLSVFGMTLLFVLISFGGWCFEKVGRYFLYGSLGDRGFLSLPLCPIYGTCVLGIGLLFGTPQIPSPLLTRLCSWVGRLPSFWEKVGRWGIYFLAATGTATATELVVGLTFRQIGIPLWDYSARAGNFMGVICPSFSLLWGFLLTLLMGMVWDRLCLLIEKIPKERQKSLAVGLVVLIGGDFLFNCLFVLFRGERFLIL